MAMKYQVSLWKGDKSINMTFFRFDELICDLESFIEDNESDNQDDFIIGIRGVYY